VATDRKSKWYCGEQAQFLGWLLRQLGYKVQYKNIVPSKADSKPPHNITVHQQTAAINVCYTDSWHLYDPFESFSEEDGGLDAYVKKKGDCAAPYSDAYVFIWERGDYHNFTWDAPEQPRTEDYLNYHMKSENWKKSTYILKQAGIMLRNQASAIRIGLGVEEALTGWISPEVYSDTLLGARYRPYGRPLAPSMGSGEWTPATDECIEFNIYVETEVLMQVFVSNVGDADCRSSIEVVSSSNEFLQTQIEPTLLKKLIAPGGTKMLVVPLRVLRLRWPPPPPVTGVRGCLGGRRLFLRWNESERAKLYRVYRAPKRFCQPQISRTPVSYARFLATDAKSHFALLSYFLCRHCSGRSGGASELDPDERSTTVVVPPNS
jgi:hypothetical protein